MEISLLILLVAGPIGATDVIYFHLWKFRLFERPESVKEEITHIIRGIVTPTAGAILLLGQPQGLWFWAVAALFACDSLNSLADVLLEPASRAPRGVPAPELATHFVGTSLMGAASGIFMFSGWGQHLRPTALIAHTNSFLPDWVFVVGFATLFLAYILVTFETFLFARAVLRRRGLTLAHP